LVLHLLAGSGQIHQASTGEAVERPESSDREDGGSLSGEIGAGRGRWETGFVVKKNLALPIVRLNPEDRIGKEQDWNWLAVTVHHRINLPWNGREKRNV